MSAGETSDKFNPLSFRNEQTVNARNPCCPGSETFAPIIPEHSLLGFAREGTDYRLDNMGRSGINPIGPVKNQG